MHRRLRHTNFLAKSSTVIPPTPCRTASAISSSSALALSFADVLQNGSVLNFVVSVGLYFGCDTVERVFEGFL